MIKALAERGPSGCPLVMLGLSFANLEELRKGRPIQLDIDQCAMLGLGQRELMIFAGEDEIAMAREFEQRGLIGEGATERLQQEFDEYERRKRERGE